MTEEQIAELELTVGSHWHSEEDWADLRESIPRLLEERRRLLEALDSIIGQVGNACINDCGICRFCVSEGVARKAVAFAEEESK